METILGMAKKMIMHIVSSQCFRPQKDIARQSDNEAQLNSSMFLFTDASHRIKKLILGDAPI